MENYKLYLVKVWCDTIIPDEFGEETDHREIKEFYVVARDITEVIPTVHDYMKDAGITKYDFSSIDLVESGSHRVVLVSKFMFSS